MDYCRRRYLCRGRVFLHRNSCHGLFVVSRAHAAAYFRRSSLLRRRGYSQGNKSSQWHIGGSLHCADGDKSCSDYARHRRKSGPWNKWVIVRSKLEQLFLLIFVILTFPDLPIFFFLPPPFFSASRQRLSDRAKHIPAEWKGKHCFNSFGALSSKLLVE